MTTRHELEINTAIARAKGRHCTTHSLMRFRIFILEPLCTTNLATAYSIVEKHLSKYLGRNFTAQTRISANGTYYRKTFQKDLIELHGTIYSNINFVCAIEELEDECLKSNLNVYTECYPLRK